jgi:hypothetical protein
MGVVFPKRRIRNTETVDPEDFNKNLLPFAEAAEARLNEHNWATEAFDASTTDRDYFSGNIGFTVRKAVQDVDHTAVDNGDPKADAIIAAEGAGGFEINHTATWATVSDAELTFDTIGGMALIFAQAVYWTTCDEEATEYFVSEHDPGIQLAIRVDGAIIPESVTGSAESTNELNDADNSTGIVGVDQIPVTISLRTLEPLGPGRHTVELVVRLCGPQTATTDAHFILRRELNILEMGAG